MLNKKQLSRRDFLKLAATASSGAFLIGYVGSSRNVASAQDATELTFGRHWEAAFRPVQEEFDDNFMEENPDIEINITYNTWGDHNNVVPAWAAAGTLPDIIYVHGSRVAPWAAEGIIVDIQSLVDPDSEFNVEGIWEESLRLYRVDGNLHGIPYDHGPLILGYNKDMFDAAGMDYPTTEWTMEDLLNAAVALTDPDQLQWGWSGELDLGSGGSHTFLGPWGGGTMNDDETQMILDTDEAREALNFWYTLIHELNAGPSATEAEGFGDNPWQNGRTAMAVVPSWETPSLAQFASFEWDVAPWPMGTDGTRIAGSFGSGYGITSDSENPDVAWRYLREYLSTDGMIFMWGLTGRGSPARPDALESWLTSEPAPESAHFYLEAMQDYAVTGNPFQTLAAPQVLDILGREAELLRLGETTVDDAIAAIMEEGQEAMDEVAD